MCTVLVSALVYDRVNWLLKFNISIVVGKKKTEKLFTVLFFFYQREAFHCNSISLEQFYHLTPKRNLLNFLSSFQSRIWSKAVSGIFIYLLFLSSLYCFILSCSKSQFHFCLFVKMWVVLQSSLFVYVSEVASWCVFKVLSLCFLRFLTSDIILLCKILSIRYLNSLMDTFNQIP